MSIETAKAYVLQLEEGTNAPESSNQSLPQAVSFLKTLPEQDRYAVICDAILKLRSVKTLIQSAPDDARGIMTEMTKLLPDDAPSFTSDDVSAHKRENYDDIYTLVIFFNESAEEPDKREATIYMACKKGWAPEQLANHWARNPKGEMWAKNSKGENHQWESHRRRRMLPYLIKAFKDVKDNDALSESTRTAASDALININNKIGRIMPELFGR